MTRFDKLLEPAHIGTAAARNRIIKTASVMYYGHGNKRNLYFYEALAKGGVGLIIVEPATIEFPLGMIAPPYFHIESDETIPFYAELTKGIHKHGCPAFLSLLHAGPYHTSYTGLQPVASSARATEEMPVGMMWKMPPRELSVPEVENLVDQFAAGALRAKAAGFDGIEINASTFHLINSFLSRFWNRRDDAYGGSLENRAKFLVDIITEVKARTGADFPLIALINAAEYGLGDLGLTLDEGVEIARLAERAGADAVHVRAYGYGDFFNVHFPELVFYPEPPEPFPASLDASRNGKGAFIPLAAAIKKTVSVPVIAVGRLDPELGEQLLERGQADFVGMTRRLIADNELPNKVAAGKSGDIRECMGCVECLRSSRNFSPQGLHCRVNTLVGSDREYELAPAATKRKVLVVGGGPAGMEAARVAAARGHDVTLVDKEPRLGGLVPLAGVVMGNAIEDCGALVEYFKRQLEQLGVDVQLGTEVDAPFVERFKPDAVVVGIGGTAVLPDVPGIESRNVVKNADLHHMLKQALTVFRSSQALSRLTKIWMPVGKQVAIVGGSLQGCELAEFLLKRGRKVTILDTGDTLGADLVELRKFFLFRWFARKGATLMPAVTYEQITDEGVVVTDKDGVRRTIEADSVVPVLPMAANTLLFDALRGTTPEIHLVGDCREPHLMLDAIADGARVGQAL
jgi:2,4-dienoyl-CoA reductase (NADPH2)